MDITEIEYPEDDKEYWNAIKKIKKKEVHKLLMALNYYADPDTYFAIGVFPDPPCGDFINDYSDTEIGEKPGKLARQVLDEIIERLTVTEH